MANILATPSELEHALFSAIFSLQNVKSVRLSSLEVSGANEVVGA